MAQDVLINGKAYEFTDIKVRLLGRSVRGVTAINYHTDRSKENNYGDSKKPVSRTRGTESYDASISLEMAEVAAIEAALGQGQKLTDIPPFPITVVYSPDGQRVVTDVLYQVEFTSHRRQSSQGDGRIVLEFPLIVADIDYNK